MKLLSALNDFMNDNDRGPGHGLMQGTVYGFVILTVASFLSLFFPSWLVAVTVVLLCVANHTRVLYQELEVEGWFFKNKTGDFWFDSIFRPLQTDIVSCLFFFSPKYWFVILSIALLVGFKRKNEWPLFIFWR